MHNCVISSRVIVLLMLALAGPVRQTKAADTSSPGLFAADGEPHAAIVIPHDAGAVERYVAADLQAVFEQISGARLPITHDDQDVAGNRILLGHTRWTDAIVSCGEREALNREGYIARLAGRDLAIIGGGPYGTAYGVAELYERLGARWYLPGELGAVIPQRDTIQFDTLDVQREPFFEMRQVGTNFAWNLRNRTNRLDEQDMPSPGFEVYPHVYHTTRIWIPVREVHDEHPEWFALVDGKRTTDQREFKLCQSNPEVARFVAERMGDHLERQEEDVYLLSLSPTDHHGWCECEACIALDDRHLFGLDEEALHPTFRSSRRLMVFYNRVAEHLATRHPDQRILIGAYSHYTWPPLDRTIKAHPNLAVVIANFDPLFACLAHGVTDPSCEVNARYRHLILQWKQMVPDIYFYEYYNKVAWMDLPWPIERSIAADMTFYQQIGAKGLYTQYWEQSIWPNFLGMYVAAQMLWDPSLDVDDILDEFYTDFYRNAAEPMRRYHETLQQGLRQAGHPDQEHISGSALWQGQWLFTEELVAALWQHLEEAEALAEDELVQARLVMMRKVTEHTAQLASVIRLKHRARAARGQERLNLWMQAYQRAAAIRADVKARPDYWDGVIRQSGYFEDNRGLHNRMKLWRKELVEGGMTPE